VSAGSVSSSVPVTLAGRHAIQQPVSVLSSREQTPSLVVRQVSLQSQQRQETSPGSVVVRSAATRSVSQQPHQPQQQQQPALIHQNPLLQQERGHGSIVRQFSLPRVLRPPAPPAPLISGQGASADIAIRTPGMHSPKEVRRPPRATEAVQITVQPPVAATMAAAAYIPPTDTPKTGASVATSIAGELAHYSSDHGGSAREPLAIRQQEQAEPRSSGASSCGGGEAGSTPRRVGQWEQELPSTSVTPPGGAHAPPEAYIINGPESLLVTQSSVEPPPAPVEQSNHKLEAVRQQAERLMRLSEAENPIPDDVKLQECEDRLATCARLRRKQRSQFENAQRTTQEKEEAVENARRVLRALEEQERKVRAEGSCIAGCSSTSLRQHWEARLRVLLSRRRDAEATVKMAQQQLECQAQAEQQLKEQLRKGGQRAMAAMEAVSRQRACMQPTPPQSPACSQRQSSVVRQPSTTPDIDRSQRNVGCLKGKPQPSVLTSASPLARVSRGPRCRPGGLPPSIADVQKPVTRSQSPSTLRRSLRQQKAEHAGLTSSASSDSLLPAGREGRSERGAEFSGEARGGSAVLPCTVEAGNDGDIALRAMEALQTAQLLQEKLAAMPEHLRQGITKQCAERCGLTEASGASASMSVATSTAL